MDRARAQNLGLTQRDVATSLLVSLSGSLQTEPNFWVDPKNNVSYPLVVQVPQYQLDTLSELQNIPVRSDAGSQILGGLATIARGQGEAVVSHYDVQPTIDIFGSPQDRDLGAVAGDIKRILRNTAGEVPKGSEVVLRGQVKAMDTAYGGSCSGWQGRSY